LRWCSVKDELILKWLNNWPTEMLVELLNAAGTEWLRGLVMQILEKRK